MKLATQPIHTFSNGLSAKDPPLEFRLSRYIRQCNPQQYRKQARGRSQEHDDTKDHEGSGKHILKDPKRYADRRGLSPEPIIALWFGKVVVGHSHDEPRDDDGHGQ